MRGGAPRLNSAQGNDRFVLQTSQARNAAQRPAYPDTPSPNRISTAGNTTSKRQVKGHLSTGTNARGAVERHGAARTKAFRL
jgi:hypothetical protein